MTSAARNTPPFPSHPPLLRLPPNQPGGKKPTKRKKEPFLTPGGNPSPKKDAKNIELGKPAPDLDPSLEAFAIFEKTAAHSGRAEPVATTLPLEIPKKSRVVYIGNTLLDRAADFGHFEALLQQHHPDHQLEVRNLSWATDEVDLQPRPDNFGTLDQHLTYQKADIIFAAFGYNESFDGLEAIPEFKKRLSAFLRRIKASAFNGKTGPQIVLISPTANENVAAVAAADLNNANLKAYSRAMAEVAAKQEVAFIDVFTATEAALKNPKTDHTFNGVHLEENGYQVFAETLC